MNDLPISTGMRSIERKQKKRQREEPEEGDVENQPEKMSRSLKPLKISVMVIYSRVPLRSNAYHIATDGLLK